jgi:hypothetical protein
MSADNTTKATTQLITVPQLTQVWTTNIQSWFIYAENEFDALGIQEQRLKFQITLRSLTRELFDEVTPLMMDHKTTDPYDLLKEALLKRLALSDKQRADELFRDIELGDQKPTQLLRRMRQLLNGQQLDERLLKQLFLQKLPKQAQTALAACRSVSLDELAETADAVIEAYSTSVSCVTTNPIASTSGYVSMEEFSKLFKEVLHIREELKDSRNRNRHNSRRTPSRHRSFSRSRSRSRTRNTDFCWYHEQYGPAARNCRPPCSFSKNQKSQGN